MPIDKVFHRTNEKNETELYERTGLWLLLKLFHYFGFRLLNDPTQESCVSRIYVGVVFTLTLLSYAISAYFLSFLFINNDGGWDWEKAGFYFIMGSGYVATFIDWLLALTKAKDFSVLMRSLVSAIDAIPNVDRKAKVVRRVKKIVFIFCILYLIGGIFVEIISFFCAENHIKQESQQVEDMFIFYIVMCSATNIFWFLTVGAFYLFVHAVILTVCGILNEVIQVYLKSEVESKKLVKNLWADPKRGGDVVREERLNRVLIVHRKMSLIVETANSALNQLLLLTLTYELLLCVCFVKMITMEDGTLSSGAYVNSFHILFLFVKVYSCSQVNDNLKSSIALKKLPVSDSFSNEQVNYLLYQNDQQINRAQITYGNIFPIRKTFIFTVAGTALTYAIVLHGV